MEDAPYTRQQAAAEHRSANRRAIAWGVIALGLLALVLGVVGGIALLIDEETEGFGFTEQIVALNVGVGAWLIAGLVGIAGGLIVLAVED